MQHITFRHASLHPGCPYCELTNQNPTCDVDGSCLNMAESCTGFCLPWLPVTVGVWKEQSVNVNNAE